MDKDSLQYDKMVEAALRGVVRQALAEVAESGLTGNHHFFVTFKTGHPGVRIPAHLEAEFPDEMTIVLQHQFWGLEAGEDAFDVTLGFNDVQERLTVPYAALTAFVDPSVKFGLQFQPAEAGKSGGEPRTPTLLAPSGVGHTGLGGDPASARPAPARNDRSKALGEPAAPKDAGHKQEKERETKEDPGGEKIVSLDAFRKK
ncbi:MAG: hypothetical protein IIC57_00170 [Proteobacteria bacterium]|nr:hypothetical protein [Pseudomonadota bacterium]